MGKEAVTGDKRPVQSISFINHLGVEVKTIFGSFPMKLLFKRVQSHVFFKGLWDHSGIVGSYEDLCCIAINGKRAAFCGVIIWVIIPRPAVSVGIQCGFWGVIVPGIFLIKKGGQLRVGIKRMKQQWVACSFKVHDGVLFFEV